MTFTINLIKRLFPNKIITRRISDLIELVKDEHINNTHICLSIQNNYDTREFCYVTLDELTKLFKEIPLIERCLYELIFPTKQVKTYIDFEYYIENNADIKNPYIGPTCFIKILYNLLNFQQSMDCKTNDNMNFILEQFLVLDSCTSNKISYHFIHANPSVLFDNNITLGSFIKTVMHFLLFSIAQHTCPSFNIDFNSQQQSIKYLLILLTPYINTLRKCCVNCQLYDSYVTVSEIAHLLVLNKQNQLTTAIDVHVFSKYQQFRLFDCVKRGQMNPLIPSSHFKFYLHVENSYNEILQRSLITYIQQLNLPIISIKNNQFQWTMIDENNSLKIINNNVLSLNYINRHFSSFCILDTKSVSHQQTSNSNIESRITYNKINHDDQVELFRPFVENLIKQDKNHQGFVRSYVRGTYNKDMLFFNIGGQYRYCEKKGTHHKRNTSAILINTKTHTYSIRCKDVDCDNRSLIWKKIQ